LKTATVSVYVNLDAGKVDRTFTVSGETDGDVYVLANQLASAVRTDVGDWLYDRPKPVAPEDHEAVTIPAVEVVD
jgi:hypothetical protein